MRIGTSKRGLLACLVTTIAMLGIFSTPAHANGYPVINQTWDINAICQSFGINCSSFVDKWQAWTNAGPDDDMLLPDGTYFFAVLDDEDGDPNDGGSGNLSASDTMSNRTFTVSSGKISSYGGNHGYGVDYYDRNEKKIQLAPFGDNSKTSSNGNYTMAMCKKSTQSGHHYTKTDCSYHVFHCGNKDTTPPRCPKPTFGLNTSGQWTATAVFQDSGGIKSLSIIDITNATYSVSSFTPGTTGNVTLKCSKINQAKPSRVVVKVSAVSGNYSICDPVLATLKGASNAPAGAANQSLEKTFHVTAHENTVKIYNGAHGFSKLAVTVNGKRFAVKLRSGQHYKLKIDSALLATGSNKVVLQGTGRAGTSATVLIS